MRPSAGHHLGQPIGAPATIRTLAPLLLMRPMRHPRPAAARRAPQRPRHAVSPVYRMRLFPIAPAICPHTHPTPTPAVVHACPCDTSACFGPDQHVPVAPTRCAPFPTHPCTMAHQRQLRRLPALAPTCRHPRRDPPRRPPRTRSPCRPCHPATPTRAADCTAGSTSHPHTRHATDVAHHWPPHPDAPSRAQHPNPCRRTAATPNGPALPIPRAPRPPNTSHTPTLHPAPRPRLMALPAPPPDAPRVAPTSLGMPHPLGMLPAPSRCTPTRFHLPRAPATHPTCRTAPLGLPGLLWMCPAP